MLPSQLKSHWNRISSWLLQGGGGKLAWFDWLVAFYLAKAWALWASLICGWRSSAWVSVDFRFCSAETEKKTLFDCCVPYAHTQTKGLQHAFEILEMTMKQTVAWKTRGHEMMYLFLAEIFAWKSERFLCWKYNKSKPFRKLISDCHWQLW